MGIYAMGDTGRKGAKLGLLERDSASGCERGRVCPLPMR